MLFDLSSGASGVGDNVGTSESFGVSDGSSIVIGSICVVM